jgi:hypothetical protein
MTLKAWKESVGFLKQLAVYSMFLGTKEMVFRVTSHAWKLET